MVEHLKWARTSPSGTDSDLIGAWRAVSAYLYNYVTWGLSKGGKKTEEITKEKLQSENFINHIAFRLISWYQANQQVVWRTCSVYGIR